MTKFKEALEMHNKAESSQSSEKPKLSDAAKESIAETYSHGTQARKIEGAVESPAIRKEPVPAFPMVEKLPDFNIDVDQDQLREAGLLPDRSDFEFIGEQFRRLKRPILNLAFGRNSEKAGNSNVIMMASALPNSGKSFCSFNLAYSISRERDFGAVLVDADVINPFVSKALQLEDHVGLIDYLLDPAIKLDDILISTDFCGIFVVPAGQRHSEATELLASRRMEQFLAELSAWYPNRTIIADTPPLLLTNEANVLAEHMGQIVLVVEEGVTTQESVSQAVALLNRSKPINVILNKSRGAVFGEYGGTAYEAYAGHGAGNSHDAKFR